MKKALVLGSSGFLGSRFFVALQRLGYDVDGWDIKDTNAPWEPHVTNDCMRLFTEPHCLRYDLVVHAAAQEPHRMAIDTKPATFAYNSMLDASLFSWAIRTNQRQVLYLSSSAAYPVDLQDGFENTRTLHESDINLDAEHLCVPDSPYGWTKLTGEKLATAARAAGVAVTVVRPFSGYAKSQGTDWPFGAFLARAAQARSTGEPFRIWGSGHQVRDWIHADDVINGALFVAASGTDQPVNLATGIGTSMTELSRLICSEFGFSPRFEYDLTKPSGVTHRVGSAEFLHNFYVPKISIEEGVKLAVGEDR